jgi:nicotinamide riboside kinase
VRRVAIVGTESTGKTTLAQQLAEHFQTVWVPEYGRAFRMIGGSHQQRFTAACEAIERLLAGPS